MILTIIFLPLLSFLIAFFNTNLIRRSSILSLTTLLAGLNVLQIIVLFVIMFVTQENYFIELGHWIETPELVINWAFYIDNLTIVMLIVVSSVSFLVHLYSMDYMGGDFNAQRFMSYLSLFTFFMIILITGDNFLILFLGWEGVGLCSYLLISFWFTRIQANKSAIKALVVNRISDFALVIGLIYIYTIFNTLDFTTIFALVPFYSNETVVFLGYQTKVINLISMLLFIGAMGKSAQIGLHTWLPDAMEGPTPVSALIHAATMVTAGVFLVIKCSPIFEYAPLILVFITFVGGLTAFFSATVGLVQNDIKKVIAYSTCSQLGYMIFACGLSSYHVAFFHLVNHAFFKALLFLTAGAIIHSLSNEQDMRKYGGLIKLLPYSASMLFIGSLSLMGFPFLTGFYSKDLILEIAYSKYTLQGSFCYLMGLLTALFTSIYSYRVFYLTFIYNNNSFKKVLLNVHELPIKMFCVLTTLAIGSIFLGYFAKELFVGFGTDFWNQNIYIFPNNNQQFEIEFIPAWIKLIPFINTFIAIIIVHLLFETVKFENIYNIASNNYCLRKVYSFLSYKWFFDVVYNKYVNSPILDFSYKVLFKMIDKGLLENIGPSFFVKIISLTARRIKSFQTGQVYRYGYFMVIFFVTSVILFLNIYV